VRGATIGPPTPTPTPNPSPQGGGEYSCARRKRSDDGEAGFTLFEALVALALLMGFVAVLGPHLAQARRIMGHAEDRVAAQVLLRALLDAPFDRSALANAAREGETGNLRWRVVTEPAAGAPVSRNWSAYRVTASVAWGTGQAIEAQTIRLARPER
jgi:Tfp pilus assembly protein PilV